jgi:hypothetical protein
LIKSVALWSAHTSTRRSTSALDLFVGSVGSPPPTNLLQGSLELRRKCLSEQLNRPNVAGHEDEARIYRVHEALDLDGDVFRIVLPRVLGALLVTALRPPARTGPRKRVISAAGLAVNVCVAEPERVEVRAPAIGEYQNVRGALLAPFDNRQKGRERRPGRVLGRRLRTVLGVQKASRGRDSRQAPPPEVRSRHDRIDVLQNFLRHAAVV